MSQYFDDVGVSSVRLGFDGMKMKNFCICYDNFRIRMSSLNVKWDLSEWFAHKVLNLTDVTIGDLEFSVDSNSSEILYYEKREGEGASRQTIKEIVDAAMSKWNQCMRYFQLPISVGKLTVSGSLDVHEKIFCDFSANLVDWAPNKTTSGNFSFDSVFTSQLKEQFIASGNFSIHRDMCGLADSINVYSSIISKSDITKFERSFSLDMVHNEKSSSVILVDNQADGKIFDLSYNADGNTKNVKFRVDVVLTDEVAKNFTFGVNLDPMSIYLHSVGEYNFKLHSGLAKTDANVVLSRNFFHAFFPELKRDLGVKFTAAVGITNGIICLESLNGELSSADGKQISSTFNLAESHSFSGKDNDTWSYLKGLKTDITVSKLDTSIFGALCGNLRLNAIASGHCAAIFKENCLMISLPAGENLHLLDANLYYMGDVIFSDLTCSFASDVTIGDGIEVGITRLELADEQDVDILQGDVDLKINGQVHGYSGYLCGNLAGILKQPIFKERTDFPSGLGTLSFNLTEKNGIYSGSVEMKLKANTGSGGELCQLNGNLNINLADTLLKDEETKFTIDGRLHGISDSDILASGSLVKNTAESMCNVQADVRSSELCLSDLADLCNLFAINPNRAHARVSFSLSDGMFNSDVAPWNNFGCNVDFKVNALLIRSMRIGSDLSGSVKINPTSIEVSNTTCYIINAPFALSASIIFDNENKSNVYNIKTTFSLLDVNANTFLLALGYPQKVLSGVFDIDGGFESSGYSLDDAFSRLNGKVDISGTEGNIALMALLSNGQKGLIGLSGVVGSLLNIGDVTDLIHVLDDIRFDKVFASIAYTRKHGTADVTLNDFIMTSDDIRVISSGVIECAASSRFEDCTIYFETQVSAKGNMINTFDNLGWSKGGPDFYGYETGPTFVIRGTVGEPDLSDLKKLLLSASMTILSNRGKDESKSEIFDPGTLLKIFQK
jgi:hypothetical protein